MNGRDTRFRSLPVVKQFELANTPMKTELYVGLDVHRRRSSATAGESEHKLQSTCFHESEAGHLTGQRFAGALG
jgi:hypothetical protein